jgi:hypothetical protein
MAVKQNLTTEVKKRMIADAIVISHIMNLNIMKFSGVPVSKFDYATVLKYIQSVNELYKKEFGEDFNPPYGTKYK